MNPNPSVSCRRCGTQIWKLYTTTAVLINTVEGKFQDSAYLRREFRCATCDTKATVEQVAQLESLNSRSTKASTEEVSEPDTPKD